MSNAKRLYEQIISIDYIKSSILGISIEDTWLECKQKQDPGKDSLSESDESNFAKALSGFANTSGGVLIFGLMAEKISEGAEIIKDIAPIKKLSVFEARLKEKEPRIVERSISGIEYRKLFVNEKDDEGILIIYIPESINPPHRSLKDKNFYLRAGGSFFPLDVPQIESLVLKNIKPDLDIDFIVFTDVDIRTCSDKRLHMYFNLTNTGKTIAKNIFVRLQFTKNSKYKIEVVGHHQYHISRDDLGVTYDWHYEKVIHPGISVCFEEAGLFMRSEAGSQKDYPAAFEADIFYCAENMPLKKLEIRMTERQMFERLLQPGKRVNLLRYSV